MMEQGKYLNRKKAMFKEVHQQQQQVFPQISYQSPLQAPGSNKMIYDLTPATPIVEQVDHITLERERLERHLRKISQELTEMKLSQQMMHNPDAQQQYFGQQQYYEESYDDQNDEEYE